MRVCVIYCCCSKWEAATLFGSKECFPCLSPSACALAAPSVFKTLSAIVLVHGAAAGIQETTTGLFFFSPFFSNTFESLFFFLQQTVVLGTVQGSAHPPLSNPELDCQRGEAYHRSWFRAHGAKPLYSPVVDQTLVHFTSCLIPLCARNTPTSCPSSFTFEPTSTFPSVGNVSNLLFYSM